MHDARRSCPGRRRSVAGRSARGEQIGLLTLRHPEMTMDDAYAVQNAILRAKLAAGRRVIGWKIGLTSKAMQYALNIDIPDSGILFDDMAVRDWRDGARGPVHPAPDRGRDRLCDEGAAGRGGCHPRRRDRRDRLCRPVDRNSRHAHPAGRSRHRAGRAACSTRSATTPPMPASCWARNGTPLTPLICAGSGRSRQPQRRGRGNRAGRGRAERSGGERGLAGAPHGAIRPEHRSRGRWSCRAASSARSNAPPGTQIHADFGPFGSVDIGFA